ncbi:MAG: hypothetical protein GX330_08780 [Bacteroidales bacterium]|nr:hypothetical protein [Bacteroidales bacterium]
MKSTHIINKGLLIVASIYIFSFLSATAQSDTMYIMKSGFIVGQYHVHDDIDSIIFYKPEINDTNRGRFTDIRDGNTYIWVRIGNQVWMAENLKYLPKVVGVNTGSDSIPCYYVYDYDSTDVNEAKLTSNYKTYGVLYNWSAAMAGRAGSTTNPSDVQGVCPSGWHMPSASEWNELVEYAGGVIVAGDKLKEAGTTHWDFSHIGVTNETRFTALPGGYRYIFNGVPVFKSMFRNGSWWTATEDEKNDTKAWYRGISGSASNIGENTFNKEIGFSVRCVRD